MLKASSLLVGLILTTPCFAVQMEEYVNLATHCCAFTFTQVPTDLQDRLKTQNRNIKNSNRSSHETLLLEDVYETILNSLDPNHRIKASSTCKHFNTFIRSQTKRIKIEAKVNSLTRVLSSYLLSDSENNFVPNRVLESLDLSWSDEVTPEDLTFIGTYFQSLRSLNLEGVDLNDSQLSALSSFRSLETLNLTGNWISDSGLEVLGNLENLIASLKTLDLSYSLHKNKITDAGVSHLANLGNLEDLNLSGNSSIMGSCFESLSQLEKLRSLGFQNIKRSVRTEALPTFRFLMNTPTLESLDLSFTDLDPEELDQIGQLAQLKKLELAGCNLNPENIPVLFDLNQLDSLNLRYNHFYKWNGRDANQLFLEIAENLPLKSLEVSVSPEGMKIWNCEGRTSPIIQGSEISVKVFDDFESEVFGMIFSGEEPDFSVASRLRISIKYKKKWLKRRYSKALHFFSNYRFF